MLSVLNVAYPFAAVGPNAVGGAEQVLTAIDAALVAHGHRSLVIACEGSSTSGTLLPLPAGLSPDEQARTHALLRRRIEDVWDDVDLIHLHGIDFPAYLPRAGKPVLVTLHLPPDWYPQEIFASARADTWLNCVSEGQHQRCPPSSALLKPIRNGVPVRQLAAASHAKRGFALMLGRICPEKGQHLGLEAAHQAGVSALLGGVAFGYPAHIDYFESHIKPLLDRHRRHVGPVGFARKRRLLAAARCVLVPSLAAETSSLVAMEAIAAGTPVIAFASGALPQIVDHGRTGFIVSSAQDMAAAIGHAHEISPGMCRKVAAERFSACRMTRNYIETYQTLLS